MINTHNLKLPLSRTYFHGSKGFQAIEVLLYNSTVHLYDIYDHDTTENNESHLPSYSENYCQQKY